MLIATMMLGPIDGHVGLRSGQDGHGYADAEGNVSSQCWGMLQRPGPGIRENGLPLQIGPAPSEGSLSQKPSEGCLPQELRVRHQTSSGPDSTQEIGHWHCGTGTSRGSRHDQRGQEGSLCQAWQPKGISQARAVSEGSLKRW